MAENKKSFVLYSDIIHTVKHLSDEQKGQLFMHILSYVNDENPVTDNVIINLAFEPIKQQLKRDLAKYEDKKKQWSEAGKRSAEARKAKKELTNLTNVNERSNRSTDLTVNDNVNVNVTVNDNVIKNNIDKRKQDFKKSLIPFLDKYGKELIKEFFEYWTEHGLKDKKMKFEKQKSFGIARRLVTWEKNNQKWKQNNNTKKSNYEANIEANRNRSWNQ